MVTAPGSGAEVIPFLKTWVNLPAAIGFTVLYAKVRVCAAPTHVLSPVLPTHAADAGPSHWRTARVQHEMYAGHGDEVVCHTAVQLANILSTEQLFYACIFPFIAFFGAFAFILYPLRETLHPTGVL